MAKFAYIAKRYSDAGYEVFGYNYKGFGHSEGTRGLIDSSDSFLQDGYNFVLKVKEFLKSEYPNNDISLVGCGMSMGGTLVVGL